MGPTMPKPGPMLLIQALSAVKVDSRSKPFRLSSSHDTAYSSIYTEKYACTPRTCFSGMARPSIRTLTTALGWIIFRISIKAAFTNVTTRVTFRPPPVDPAQPPTNISSTSTVLA